MLALSFQSAAFGPGFVQGIVSFALYGLVAITMVVTYRISRTVAFINGGIVLTSTLCYWWLVNPPAAGVSSHPHINGYVGWVIVAIGGFVIAAVYGWLVTGKRIGEFPRLTVTIISLAGMLLLVGIAGTVITGAQGQPGPTPVKQGAIKFGSTAQITYHQLVTLVFLGLCVLGLQALLKTTRTGVFARAIGDNAEAARLVGIPIGKVSTLMYGLSGAIAAMAGALMGPTTTTDQGTILFEFLRGMMVCLVGGFGSIGLALGGAMVFALADTWLQSGLFGSVDPGMEETIVTGLLFLTVVLITRYGKSGKDVLAAKGF